MSDQVKFTIESLEEHFDYGALGISFDLAWKQIVKDCQDRPALDKDRSVVITISARPHPDLHAPTITADNIVVQGQISTTLPKKKTNIVIMRTKQDGSSTLHPMLQNDPTGDALYDDDVRQRERKGK